MQNIYKMVKKFKEVHPLTVAFRLKEHASVIQEHINPDEKVIAAFCGQKNHSSFIIINSCVFVLTDKRILIGQKRLLWGYFLTSVTPDMYNDLKVTKNLIWSDVEIDTVKENLYFSNLDPSAAGEIETAITSFMMEEKSKYGSSKKNN